MSRNNLYYQKLESLPYISAADSMGLYLLLFTQLFFVFAVGECRYWDDRPRVVSAAHRSAEHGTT